MVARIRRQILTTKQEVACHGDRVERIAKIVPENAHHPLAKGKRLAQMLLRSLLLGDVRRRAHDTNNPAAAIAECFYGFAIMTTLAADGQIQFLNCAFPSV